MRKTVSLRGDDAKWFVELWQEARKAKQSKQEKRRDEELCRDTLGILAAAQKAVTNG